MKTLRASIPPLLLLGGCSFLSEPPVRVTREEIPGPGSPAQIEVRRPLTGLDAGVVWTWILEKEETRVAEGTLSEGRPGTVVDLPAGVYTLRVRDKEEQKTAVTVYADAGFRTVIEVTGREDAPDWSYGTLWERAARSAGVFFMLVLMIVSFAN